MSEQPRLIKKYPNRRLYDTKTSAYITLSDVKDLVLAFENFRSSTPRPARTCRAASCCRSSSRRKPAACRCFDRAAGQMIRFYGHAMQGMLGKYLENNIKAFHRFPVEDAGAVTHALWRREQPDAERHVDAVPEFPGAGHAAHDVGLHGPVEEDGPADAGTVAEPDAQHVHRLPVSHHSARRQEAGRWRQIVVSCRAAIRE